MQPVAPVRKIRIGAVYHSSLVVRDTLIDVFHDLSRARGDFLVHDDGFRSRTHTYGVVGRAASAAWRLHQPEWPQGDPPPVSIARDDVVEIIFTSGATADPKGVVITHRNVLANTVPVEREVLKYRKWGTPFYPLRFLNLLPLSHMFGQAMATFIPPMIPGVVVFMRGYNRSEIAAQIKSRRISVLVSVPKILDVLREHVERQHKTT